MADNNKKQFIKYENTTYLLEDHRLPDPTAEDNGKVLGVINGEYALKDEEGGSSGAVTSVNGKTGAVTLSASDVHALPDSTVIPTVPQMATDPDMTDWTSGKTVDAAVLATDLGLIGRVLTAKYTKPSGGIPASDLASDVQTSLGKADTALQSHQSLSGYATESYVQTAIAAIPAELPTVTASDNGKFLRVVSGAWAAATVPSAESNSFGGGTT